LQKHEGTSDQNQDDKPDKPDKTKDPDQNDNDQNDTDSKRGMHDMKLFSGWHDHNNCQSQCRIQYQDHQLPTFSWQ